MSQLSARELDAIIEREAPKLLTKTAEIAAWALNEPDFRQEFEKALQPFKDAAGITLRGHHEFTLGEGRVDTLYSLVVIEYKKPGRLENSNSASGNKEVIDQIKQRFRDLATEHKRQLEQIFGVGIDGKRMIFVRYKAKEFEISAAMELDTQSISIFLKRLSTLGLAKKPFVSKFLVRDFGGESALAHDIVQQFVESIFNLRRKRAKKLFDQWSVMYREVCGFDLKVPAKKIRFLAKHYGIEKKIDPKIFLFAVHSYYSIFIKLLAAELLGYHHKIPSIVSRLTTLSGPELREQLSNLEEEGGIFFQMGYINFLEGDLFTWYLDEWNSEVEKSLRRIVLALDAYDPGTIGIEPEETRDILKGLYQYLIDRDVRRSLGEYYTPDWLAELAFDEAEYDGNLNTRLLDPACGTGTFLVMAIQKMRSFATREGLQPQETLRKILNNVVGFDLNPLAVMAARTNYVMALGDLLPYSTGRIEIPVYICDSVLWPESSTTGIENTYKVRTSVGNFFIPSKFATREQISYLAESLDIAVNGKYSINEFLNLLKSKSLMSDEDWQGSVGPLRNLFRAMNDLEKEGVNGLWARFVKNSFAPIFAEKFDIVIGNPPWVNWERLPESYKLEAAKAWSHYGIFPFTGWKARLGGARYDISMVFVYVGIDKYLKNGGKLCFVITQSLFQSEPATGFRKFTIPRMTDSGIINFAVREVHHLVDLAPFEDASNRTALMLCTKGESHHYPVPYVWWTKNKPIHASLSLDAVKERVERKSLFAWPINEGNPRSPWLVCSEAEKKAIQSVIGASAYEAHEGSSTEGANGIFWIRIKDKIGNMLLVENMAEESRDEISKVQESIEQDWVYPLLRGADVHRWCGKPGGHLIFTSKSRKEALTETYFKVKWNKTYSYLKNFETHLKARPGYQKKMRASHLPFYTMYGSTKMFSDYKVVWREQISEFTAAVITSVEDPTIGRKAVIPDHKLMFVSCRSQLDAHYLCACLNSAITRFLVESYTIPTQVSTQVLKNIKIPRFDNEKTLHIELANLSLEAHRYAETGEQHELNTVEKKIDNAVAQLFDLTATELPATMR